MYGNEVYGLIILMIKLIECNMYDDDGDYDAMMIMMMIAMIQS